MPGLALYQPLSNRIVANSSTDPFHPVPRGSARGHHLGQTAKCIQSTRSGRPIAACPRAGLPAKTGGCRVTWWRRATPGRDRTFGDKSMVFLQLCGSRSPGQPARHHQTTARDGGGECTADVLLAGELYGSPKTVPTRLVAFRGASDRSAVLQTRIVGAAGQGLGARGMKLLAHG